MHALNHPLNPLAWPSVWPSTASMSTRKAIFFASLLVSVPVMIAVKIVLFLILAADELARVTWNTLLPSVAQTHRPLAVYFPFFYQLLFLVYLVYVRVQIWATGKPPKEMNRQQAMSTEILVREWVSEWLWQGRPATVPLLSSERPASSSEGAVDISIASAADGGRLPVAWPWPSLRHSLEKCLREDLQSSGFATRIAHDDPWKPRYLLHGWHAPLELSDPSIELWTTAASNPFWSCLCAARSWFTYYLGEVYIMTAGTFLNRYCFASRLSNASPHVYLAPKVGEDLGSWEGERSRAVLGYIYLLEVPDAAYHARGAPTVWDWKTLLGRHSEFECADDQRALIARRWGYLLAALTGQPTDRPDAFIFPAEAVKVTGLRVVRSYRVVSGDAAREATRG